MAFAYAIVDLSSRAQSTGHSCLVALRANVAVHLFENFYKHFYRRSNGARPRSGRSGRPSTRRHDASPHDDVVPSSTVAGSSRVEVDRPNTVIGLLEPDVLIDHGIGR